MSRELQPPLLSVSLVKIEPPTVIKDEHPESEIVEIDILDILNSSEEEIISDLKDIDIVYHPVCEKSIKSEVLESYHCESVETQVLVKAENSPFIKTENISQKNKIKDTSDENVTKGTGQVAVEIQASIEHSNALNNLETDEQSILNFSENLNGISVRNRKSESPRKTDFAECYKTDDTTLWEKEKEKIKVMKAPLIHVEAHEYTSLAKDRHVCNHCQNAYKALSSVKLHIKRTHREVTTMYQCPYCPYKSKWNQDNINRHIIQKHKDTKDIQWFQCHLCAKKFKLKNSLIQHMKIHLTHEQMQYSKRYHCDKCDYKTYSSTHLKNHKLNHLKPEEIQNFYCYHCSYKAKLKGNLKEHIFRLHFKNVKQEKRFPNNLEDHCSTIHFVSWIKSVPENASKSCIFQCTYCPTKFPEKNLLKGHLQLHSSTKGIECPICTYRHNKTEILKHLSWHGANGKDSFKCPICDLKKRTKENMDDHLKVVHSKAIYQKHDSVCKNKTCNGFCQITIGGNVGAE